MSSKSSRVQSLRSEMPLHIHSESMFGGYCIQTTKWKAFIFLYTKEEMLEKKQRQASKVNPQARKGRHVKRQGSLTVGYVLLLHANARVKMVQR